MIRGQEDREKLQSTLDNLTKWADKWGMSFNTGKCKVMHIGRNNSKFDYKMDGVTLSKTNFEKDIGVMVTDNLKPHKHCEEAVRKANGVLGQISRSFHYRDKNTFIKLYSQYVRPHLEYCSPVWNPWTQQDIQNLEKVQIRAINMVSGLKGKSYDEKLAEVGLESLENRRKKQDLVQTFKIMKNIDKVDRCDWFSTVGRTETRHTRYTSYENNLKRTRVSKTEVRNNFFSQRMISEWNSLPTIVKDSSSTKLFKSNYDNFKTNNSGANDQDRS